MNSNHVVLYHSKWPKMKKLGRLSLLISLISLCLFLLPLIRSPQANQSPPNYFQLYLQDQLQTQITSLHLYIPKLNLTTTVSLQVNPNQSQAWIQALQTGVAHALGTSLPNQPGTTYIFGHSTDSVWNINQYHAFFFGLKDLESGDQIILSSQNQAFTYQVTEKIIVAPDDLSYLTSNKNQLDLQTCWPPGTTLKRLLIIAQPIS